MAETNRKRPWLAAALAMLSPGLGHVYLREWLRAVLWFALIIVATSILVPVTLLPTELTLSAIVNSVTPALAELTLSAIVTSSLSAAEQVPLRSQLALFAITSLSMADAYWIATRGNQIAATDEGFSCPHCGRELDEDLSFCHWCTTRLEFPEEEA